MEWKKEALLSLGKIYYDDRKYLLAQPLYNEALPLSQETMTTTKN